MNTNENIVNNLKYLGLDLENVPNSIKEFAPLDYRPSKFNDEHNYKVYKYVDIKDIKILLTPTNRLCDVSEKYRESSSFIWILVSRKRGKHRKTYKIFRNG